MNPTTKNQKPLYADKTATYWWKMTMNPDQPRPSLVGYGKFEGHNENRSKIQNLMRIFEMLYTKGYFYRTSCIDIYEKQGYLANIELDTLVVRIKPQKIEYYGTDVDFQRFLANFINCVQNGISPTVHLRPRTDNRSDHE